MGKLIRLIEKHWLLAITLLLGTAGMSFLVWRDGQRLKRFEDIEEEVAQLKTASTIKTWADGEDVVASDLNANFAHLHACCGVNHGAPITNAAISASASIGHSKLATPALVPKAFAYVAPTCACGDPVDSTNCTLAASSRVTSIKSSGTTGTCRVTLAYTPANVNFAVTVTSQTSALYCVAGSFSTSAPHFTITCYDASGAATAAGFSTMVMDDNS